MSEVQRRLITYCTNVHPGESWEETFASLERYLPRIKRAVSPDDPFPVGLRLSARAVRELTPGKGRAFSRWLEEQGCFVPTINVFPFGTFHGRRVREEVYLPDWRSRQRSEYTAHAAALLGEWLPQGCTGSLSTVPVAFGPPLDGEDSAAVRRNLVGVLIGLDRLWQEKGKDIVLALEPEPGCIVEGTAGLVRFLRGLELPERLRQRIGICLDCCHLALEFEDPAAVLALLSREGVRIGKVQVSSALRVRHEALDELNPFAEPCYLHQVVVRRAGGALARYHDLPDAFLHHRVEVGEEWRCHFHVPLFVEESGTCRTTRFFAEELLPLLDRQILLEVETYSWQVLPATLRGGELTEDVIREIRWLQEETDATHRGP